MPTFAYSGRTRAGQTVTGERVADTMDLAVAGLRRDQIMVTPSLKLPAGWQYGTALEGGGTGDTLQFTPVSLTTL